MTSVACNYCGGDAELVHSSVVYGKGHNYGMMYLCRQCDAYVGCHKGTTKPLGRLANAELREWKVRAHVSFDPLWQAKMRCHKCKKSRARGAGYKWLAGQLGISRDDCHIGMFDVEICKRVVEICEGLLK